MKIRICRDIDKSGFVMMVMKKMLCEDTDWLLSEEAFSIYASCMYHPTYNDYVGLMEEKKYLYTKIEARKPA